MQTIVVLFCALAFSTAGNAATLRSASQNIPQMFLFRNHGAPKEFIKPEIRIREGAEMNKPEAEINKPEAEINKPDAEINKPEAEINKTEAEINKPEAEISKPEAEISEPKVEVHEPKTVVRRPLIPAPRLYHFAHKLPRPPVSHRPASPLSKCMDTFIESFKYLCSDNHIEINVIDNKPYTYGPVVRLMTEEELDQEVRQQARYVFVSYVCCSRSCSNEELMSACFVPEHPEPIIEIDN